MSDNVRSSGKPLLGRKFQLFEAMLTGASITDAAARCGYSARQASRILREADFRQALDEAREEAVLSAMISLDLSASLGVRVLSLLATSPRTPPSVRLRAAEDLIRLGPELAALRLASAVGDLERLLDEAGNYLDDR